MTPIHLVTSNEHKLNEFIRFGLSELIIEKGKDLEEVEADAQTVILYKALAAGPGRIVEDTSLHIEGADVGTNVRWLLENLSELHGKKATWEVLLGYHNGNQIEVYQGLVHGTITHPEESTYGFGFDRFFIPEGSELTLAQLEKIGEKDEFSARKKAVVQFLEKKTLLKRVVSDIPTWEGNYQKKI